MNTRVIALFFALALVCSQSMAGQLLLVGGGDAPQGAVARFVDWAGGKAAHLLIVPWANATQDVSSKYWRGTFEPQSPQAIEIAPFRERVPQERAKFLRQLQDATGVFFSGGDQNRVMDLLTGDPELLAALRARHAAGAVFGGTSAGTAIMSSIMMTGEADETRIAADAVQTREGLGLLPHDVIVDQHFVKRQRENRLLSAMLAHPGTLGLGIDENMAVAVDGRKVEVFGPTQVLRIQSANGGRRFLVDRYFAGETFDLPLRNF